MYQAYFFSLLSEKKNAWSQVKVPSDWFPSDVTYPLTRIILWLVDKKFRNSTGKFTTVCLNWTAVLRDCYQGYYDPTQTKIVHLSMNPSSIAKQQRGEELEKLRKENDSLRRRLQLLEEGGCSPEDISVLSKLSPEAGPSVVKQVEGQSKCGSPLSCVMVCACWKVCCFQSVLIFSILPYPCSFMVYYFFGVFLSW